MPANSDPGSILQQFRPATGRLKLHKSIKSHIRYAEHVDDTASRQWKVDSCIWLTFHYRAFISVAAQAYSAILAQSLSKHCAILYLDSIVAHASCLQDIPKPSKTSSGYLASRQTLISSFQI